MTLTARALSRAKLSQSQLSRLLGVSRLSVHAWTHGRTTPGGAAARWLTLLATHPALAILALTHATAHTWDDTTHFTED